MAERQLERWHRWYDHLIDLMLANPRATNGELCKALDCSESWLSIVKNSDMFIARFEARRAEMNRLVNGAIVSDLQEVAGEGLKIIKGRLKNQDKERLKLTLVTDITEKALNALGYGAPKGGGVTINNVQQTNVVETGADPSVLRDARDRMRTAQFERARQDALDIFPGSPFGEAQLDLALEGPTAPIDDLPVTREDENIRNLQAFLDDTDDEVELVAGGG